MATLNHSLRLSAASLLLFFLGGYVLTTRVAAEEDGDISRVNSSISIDAGEQVGDVSTVNGGIRLGNGASAKEVSTVNGSITIGDNASLTSAETVNGALNAGVGVTVDENLETINGGISSGRGTRISGSIETVNGALRLRQTEIGGDVITSRGDIDILDGSLVKGDVHFKGQRSWWNRLLRFNSGKPELTIDASSEVAGDIHLYRQVDLDIAAGSLLGEVIEHF